MTTVHLITGFLGTGKTTAILHLLSQRPEGQKWAVLVNEFGEVGIDGAIFKSRGIAVREVPGGCMCCVSGLPFQMGLNMLLAREKPDVLLIEPTGLGHPLKVLQMLADDSYQDVLHVSATLCLVDPRHLSQTRYLEHETFQDQIQLADVLIANKTDLCTATDQQNFKALLDQAEPAKLGSAWVEQGRIPFELLQLAPSSERLAHHPHAHNVQDKDSFPIVLPLAAHEPYRCFENRGLGHFSAGWLLQPQPIFHANKLRSWLNSLELERAKAIVHTDEGTLVFNLRDEVLTEMAANLLAEHRIELIDAKPLAVGELEQQLLACLEQA